MRISDWSSDVCSSDLLSRASGAGSTVPTGASTAAAPCAMACGMKSRPSARLPGSAAKRQPADTLRLSAVRPLISTSDKAAPGRSEEHTSELQSLMRISYAVFCLKKKNTTKKQTNIHKKLAEQKADY